MRLPPSLLLKLAGLLLAALTLATVGAGRKTKAERAVTAALEDPGPGPAAVLVGAGDIGSSRNAAATAKLLDDIPGTVFTAGDNAYADGSHADFKRYDRHWGRHKERTRPSPGNHDYKTSGARPYYRYFGSATGTSSRSTATST